MKKIIIPFVIIIIIAVSVFYWVNGSAKSTEAPADKHAEKQIIETITPKKGNEISLKEYLRYKVLTSDEANVALIGSSVARGKGARLPMFSWFNQLERQIKEENMSIANELNFSNFAKSGYTLNMLVEDGQVDELVSERPDLVIIETSVVNSYAKNVSMDDTIAAINTVVSKINKESPDSMVIFISPNPCSVMQQGEVENALGLTYEDYREETKSYIESKDWEFVNVYKGMEEKIQARGLELNETLYDGVHPNDLGYRLWFEVMNEYFNKKQDLSSNKQ